MAAAPYNRFVSLSVPPDKTHIAPEHGFTIDVCAQHVKDKRASSRSRGRWDGSAKEWQWLWAEVRPYARYQVGSLCFMLLAASMYAMHPLLLKWLIDDILRDGRWLWLIAWTGSFFVALVGSNALTAGGRVINHLGVMRLVYRLRMRLFNHLQALPAAFHERCPVGDVSRRVEEDVSLVGELGSDVLPSLARIVIQGLVTFVTMVLLDWRLTCMALPLVPLYTTVGYKYRRQLKHNSHEVRETCGQQTSLLHDVLTGVMQIQALCAEDRLSRRYARMNLRTMRARREQYNNEVLFTLVSMSVVSFGTSIVLGYGAWRVMRGQLTSGSLVAFWSYVGMMFAPLMSATELYARASRIRASVTRLMEIERVPCYIRDGPSALVLSARPQRVECTTLDFSYGCGNRVLEGIEFVARAGERVAIVGPSGCGKSSLVKLIPRFYDVERGKVEIDGRDVRDLQLRSLRETISFVSQDPILFQGTVSDNLRHGNPSATSEEIEQALWIACLGDFVGRLPRGLATELGRGGSQLSGGERQRLALARAILQDRPIVILDEATSALDASTEQQVLERLTPWCCDRVMIVISHRASAPAWADRVMKLEKGHLVSNISGQALRCG